MRLLARVLVSVALTTTLLMSPLVIAIENGDYFAEKMKIILSSWWTWADLVLMITAFHVFEAFQRKKVLIPDYDYLLPRIEYRRTYRRAVSIAVRFALLFSLLFLVLDAGVIQYADAIGYYYAGEFVNGAVFWFVFVGLPGMFLVLLLTHVIADLITDDGIALTGDGEWHKLGSASSDSPALNIVAVLFSLALLIADAAIWNELVAPIPVFNDVLTIPAVSQAMLIIIEAVKTVIHVASAFYASFGSLVLLMGLGLVGLATMDKTPPEKLTRPSGGTPIEYFGFAKNNVI